MWIFSQLFQRSSSKTHPTFGKRGFTLVEMLVVMGIMMIITTVLLVKQSRFDSSTVLRSLAYGMALSIRQAQVYGTSVVGTSTLSTSCNTSSGGFYNNGNCYASGYGLYFSTTLSNANPSTYVLFADLNGDGIYQTNEFIKSFSLGTGYTISNFCANGTNGGSAVSRCEPGAISSLSIVFKRPNPDAQFVALTGDPITGTPIPGDSYSNSYVQIISAADSTNSKRITVTVPGEVTVCTTVGC